MANDINLIHAGLPWTNPAQITIKSSEFINDVTINRGLLNLLNNDYYLDLKSEAINQYLEEVVKAHINDTEIHFEWQDVLDLFNRISCLTANTGWRIPLWKSNDSAMTVAEIMKIINNIPKNLNGYTLIIELAIPLTKVSDVVNSNYKITFDSSSANSPKTSNENIRTYELNNKSIIFEDFFGGTLIIWANNEYYIDNITTPDIFDNEMSTTEVAETMSFLQKNINNAKDVSVLDSDNNKLINFVGTGVNSHLSLIALYNLNCDTYIYNLAVTNTLSSMDDISGIINISQFPEANDVIGLWPLEKNSNIEYVNNQFLSQYSENSLIATRNNNYSTRDLYQEVDQISAALLNKFDDITLYDGDQPDYYTFDADYSEVSKVNSNKIREIVYNLKYKTPNTTMAFWAKLDDSNTNAPIFIDKTIDEPYSGFSLYLNRVCRADTNDVVGYNSSHQEYIVSHQTNNYVGKWAFYVIEFMHADADLTKVKNRAPYNKANILAESPSGTNMRVNMSIYWANTENGIPTTESTITSALLLPSDATYQSDSLTEDSLIAAGYEFKQPEYNNDNIVKLFANQINQISDVDTIFNWDMFSGYIRNIMFFNKFLTIKEINGIFNSGPGVNTYDWYELGESDIMNNINTSSYIGSIYAFNVNHLMATNIKTTQNM